MNLDIREAITDEASRAPAPELDLALIERRGSRRRRAFRASQGLGIVVLIVAMASVAAMLGGNTPEADLANPDVAEDPGVVTESPGTRLLDLPFEPGTVAQMGDRIFVTAASSADMTEPGQIFLSWDGGETWEGILNPDLTIQRIFSIAASDDLVLATGYTEHLPEGSSAVIPVDDVRVEHWLVEVNGDDVTTSSSGPLPVPYIPEPPFLTDEFVEYGSGFLGVVSDGETCEFLIYSGGFDWTDEGAPKCPEGVESLEESSGTIVAVGGHARLWTLLDGTFVEADLPLDGFEQLIAPPGMQDLIFGSVAADESGQIVAFAGRTHVDDETGIVERQEWLIAHSIDEGINWTIHHVEPASASFPRIITGLDHGFVTIVAGEVLRSDDGINWAPTGQSLGADLWSWEPGVVVGDRVLVPVGPAAQSANVGDPRRLAVIELD